MELRRRETIALKSFPTIIWWLDNFSHAKAICFDMDGTLLDSEPLHALALWQMVSPRDLPLEFKGKILKNSQDLHHEFVGQCDHDVFQALLAGQLWSPESTVDDFIALKNHQLTMALDQSAIEGALKGEALVFLEELSKIGIPLALVSASQKAVVESFVERLDLAKYFTVILGAEDTFKTKPHADPYLRACEMMGEDPRSCLAFEDSMTGLESATRAGLFTVKALWFS